MQAPAEQVGSSSRAITYVIPYSAKNTFTFLSWSGIIHNPNMESKYFREPHTDHPSNKTLSRKINRVPYWTTAQVQSFTGNLIFSG